MIDQVILIGGSHHLTKTSQKDHLIAREPPVNISDIPVGQPPPANASMPITVEYYDLREYFVCGTRRWFYVYRGLDKDEAARLIEAAIQGE